MRLHIEASLEAPASSSIQSRCVLSLEEAASLAFELEAARLRGEVGQLMRRTAAVRKLQCAYRQHHLRINYTNDNWLQARPYYTPLGKGAKTTPSPPPRYVFVPPPSPAVRTRAMPGSAGLTGLARRPLAPVSVNSPTCNTPGSAKPNRRPLAPVSVNSTTCVTPGSAKPSTPRSEPSRQIFTPLPKDQTFTPLPINLSSWRAVNEATRLWV